MALQSRNSSANELTSVTLEHEKSQSAQVFNTKFPKFKLQVKKGTDVFKSRPLSQSCEMSQIWRIYPCKNVFKLG